MKRTQGIALVVVLIAAAVLFVVLLSITSTLTVGSRKLTTEQQQTVRAQYAAESGITRAEGETRTLMRQVTYLVNRMDVSSLDTNTLLGYAANFCGVPFGSLNTALTTTNVMCTASPGSDASRWTLFTSLIPQSAYSAWNTANPNEPITGTPAEFWTRVFAGQIQRPPVVTSSSANSQEQYRLSAGLQAVDVLGQASGSTYVLTFEFRPANATSTGELVTTGANPTVVATRTLQRGLGGPFQLKLSPPNFSAFAQFTNRQLTSVSGSRVFLGDNAVYDGPIHTNEYYSFSAGQSPLFGKTITSAGCVARGTKTVTAGGVTSTIETCTSATPGAYVGTDSSPRDPCLVAPTATPIFAPKAGTTGCSNGNNKDKDVNYSADFIPLPPSTDATQKNAAQNIVNNSKGIYVDASELPTAPTAGVAGNLNGMTLWAAKDANGTGFSSSDWDAANNRWKQNSQYQMIEFTRDYFSYGRCVNPFSISLSPTSITYSTSIQNKAQTVKINVSRTGLVDASANPYNNSPTSPWQGAIDLSFGSYTPNNYSVSGFSADPTSPSATSSASTFTVTLSNNPTATTTVPVSGTANGFTSTQSLKINPMATGGGTGGTTTPPTPSLSTSASNAPDAIRSSSGQTVVVTTTVSANRSNFTTPDIVTFTFSGMPSGMVISTLTAPSGTGSTGNLSLPISVGPGVATGSYTITVTAKSGGLTATKTFTIRVGSSGQMIDRRWVRPFVTAALGPAWLLSATTPMLTLPTYVPTPNCTGGKVLDANYANRGIIRIQYRIAPDGTTVSRYRLEGVANATSAQTQWSSWQSEPNFNGIVYVDKQEGTYPDAIDGVTGPARISGLKDKNGATIPTTDPRTAPPAIARFQKLTIAAAQRINITGDLKYENPPCSGTPSRNGSGASSTINPAPCQDVDTMLANSSGQNILGIYSQSADIRIPNNPLPQNLEVNGILMSSAGRVYADYDSFTGSRGNFNLQGGIISNYYGQFGEQQGNTVVNGYGRAFAYDPRTEGSRLTPPFFPTFTQGQWVLQLDQNGVSKVTDPNQVTLNTSFIQPTKVP
ncbi:MAG: DUF4900 domain-containing protein [Thermaceae bacterium]|nr:DUF4900 domain-containing protein [Thermaceae bacterium]